jgi:hypothetical protein
LAQARGGLGPASFFSWSELPMKPSLPASCRFVCLAVLLFFLGCTKTPPPLTEVEGVVLLDGQPLPSAEVQFVPDLASFGSEQNSTAVTDDQGHFRLKCQRNGEFGAVVGKHFVLVKEAPPPTELRSGSAESRQKLAAAQAKLKNRPIPARYSSVSQTPLTIEVTPGQTSYTLKLAR